MDWDVITVIKKILVLLKERGQSECNENRVWFLLVLYLVHLKRLVCFTIYCMKRHIVLMKMSNVHQRMALY